MQSNRVKQTREEIQNIRQCNYYLNLAGEKTATQSSSEGSGHSSATVIHWKSSPCIETHQTLLIPYNINYLEHRDLALGKHMIQLLI